MSFRYYRRIGGKKGLGLNIGSSGISSSYRTKYGSIGSKGFSIRTGIPGLTFRSNWRSKKDSGATALVLLMMVVTLFVAYIAILILYNVALFTWWLIGRLYVLLHRFYFRWKAKKLVGDPENQITGH